MSSEVPSVQTARKGRLGLVAGGAAAVLLAGVWALASQPTKAAADVGKTTSVSAGPATFTQAVPTGGPSQYTTPLEHCARGVNHPITGPNPILSQPLTTSFTSNVPLSEYVNFTGNQWYGLWQFVFTNTSAKPISVDCAAIIFRGPSKSDQHYYLNSSTFGHPQEDYLEVPRGDGTSFYIVRLGFHDVPYAQRLVYPGGTFTYQFGGAPVAGITNTQIRDSISVTADLTQNFNDAFVLKYGTNRLTN
jgi:hypothetical protein